MSARKLAIGDDHWRYTIGHTDVVIWSPQRRRYHVSISKLLGIDIDSVYNLRHNRVLHVMPSDIKKYIEILV